MIIKRGDKYVVKSESGREMGTYASESAAKKRLAQIEMFKHIKAVGKLTRR